MQLKVSQSKSEQQHRLIVLFICLQHPQRDFKPFEAPAAGSTAAQPQRPHGLWLVKIKHSKLNKTADADPHL